MTTTTIRRDAGGFTLIELLVSIALVLILILGVNQVFKLTSDTIGGSNALSDSIRMNRAVSASMFDDLKHVVLPGEGMSRGGPFFVIRSERISAFSNAAEEAADRDYSRTTTGLATVDDQIRTVDTNGDNVESLAETPERVSLGSRSHRVDQISFFARDVYRRQTGNDTSVGTPGAYAADQASTEAWVWYGHIKQPNASGDLGDARHPGLTPLASTTETAVTNPNNFYARQWYLGRVATLLIEPEAGYIYRRDAYGRPQEEQRYIGRNFNDLSNKPLQPLGQQSESTENGTAFADPEIQWSRYDVAGTSIRGFEQILKGELLAYTNTTSINWFEGNRGLVYRFAGYPYPTNPMSPLGAARTVPCFVPACTQFVVEFAGDFITQLRDVNGDNKVDLADQNHADYGKAVSARPDGVVDFINDPPSAGTGSNRTTRIRWYGFPRNVYTGDDLPDRVVIRGTPTGGDINTMRDVVPLRDVLTACPAITSGPAPFIPALFERNVDTDLPIKADYGTATGVAASNPPARYVCAWGPAGSYTIADGSDTDSERDVVPDPQLPKMIRLVVGVDDPDSRMTSQQLYEYVVELQ